MIYCCQGFQLGKSMASTTAQEIYKRYVSSLPASERLRLLAILAQSLASEGATVEQPKRSILELYGLGKEIWEGIDAQTYVDQLRDEWERPSSSDEA